MHPVADMKTRVSTLGQNRTNRGAVVENDESDCERRLQTFAAAILMEMHGRERMEFARAHERQRFKLLRGSSAEFASVALRRKKDIAALCAAAAVDLRRGVTGVKRRLRQYLFRHVRPLIALEFPRRVTQLLVNQKCRIPHS